MKNRTIAAIISIVCTVTAIVIMLLPFSAAMTFVADPGVKYVTYTYSYLDMMNVSYARFSRPLCALSSVALFIVSVWNLIKRGRDSQ